MMHRVKNLAAMFSSHKIPIVDVQPFLSDAPSAESDCKVVVEALMGMGVWSSKIQGSTKDIITNS